MPSTGMPAAILSSIRPRPGRSWRGEPRGRPRTSGVSRSSRHGGAQSPFSTRSRSAGRPPRSAEVLTRRRRTRPAPGAPGGREHVEDPAADGGLAAGGDQLDPRVGQLDEPDQQVVEVGLSPTRSGTGSSRPRPGAIGWIRLRAARDDQPAGRVAGSASLRKIDNRRPTVSGRGERRSCGKVSQLGSTATASRPSRSAGGGGQILGLPVGRGDGEHGTTAVGECGGQERPQCRGALDGQRRDAGGRRSRDAAVRAPSSGSEVVSRPESLATIPLAAGTQDRPLPGTDGGLLPGYARRIPRESAPLPARVGTFARRDP